MKSKRTLTYSEEKAYDAVFRLMKLGMVPNDPWHAVDVGEVKNTEKILGYQKKERRIIFEWERRFKKSPQFDNTILTMVLEAVVPTLVGTEIELGEERAQELSGSLWKVKFVEIRWRFPGDRDGSVKFLLQDQNSIDFLLYPHTL